ncbi:acyl-CoA dehydrogenase family protein [Kineosporia sp. R_H_3]|uniref:acyl-CoA dehydrogenase family protein n=1 Tax=Kineosporia sp. R_H_3 TaxID=1961848 RepID=UPI0018E9FFD6|nr:acyl-CoA dehydrogenase family protein [Kineosporia sp. R_H_3]
MAFPIISGVYLGVAEAAYTAALSIARGRAEDPLLQRTIGLMRHRLQVAQWSLDGALAVVGDDPAPSAECFLAAMAAKAEVASAGADVCSLAMDVAGGQAYFKGSVIERAYRDIRAAPFHPLTPEVTHVEAGRHALGAPGLLR